MTEDSLFELPPPGVSSPSALRDSRAIGNRRNAFKVHDAPVEKMSKVPADWMAVFQKSPASPSEDLRNVAGWFESQPEGRERFRWTLRDSLDELFDGQRTGRWCYQHLSKTERTHLGTIIEINLTKEFNIANGRELDWRLGGADVDCKFSKDMGGWEMPMEMYRCSDHGNNSGKADHVALLVWVDDDRSRWAAGVVRVADHVLRWRADKAGGQSVRAYNRDNKRRLDPQRVGDIYWLWGGMQEDLPTNLLLHLSSSQRSAILCATSGQARVNSLFEQVTGRIVGRHAVLTVAQQEDAPKRVRDARRALRSSGFVIFGHEREHAKLASGLGLPVPHKGEWVSARLSRVDQQYGSARQVQISGHWWESEVHVSRVDEAPLLPRGKNNEGAISV